MIKSLLLAATVAYASAQEIEEFGTSHARAMEVMQIKERFWEENEALIGSAESHRSVKNQPAACINGVATAGGIDYPCDKVNFLSMIGREELKRERSEFRDRTFRMSDIWGWLSPSGREITISCMTNVLWFIDSTDALNPKPLGWIESHRAESSWCDTKVYKDTAYIVQDRSASGGNDKGIQVFDLLRLEDPAVQNAAQPIKFEVDFTYAEHGAVHNLVVDTDSGFLYSVGTSGGISCRGGLHMVDLSDRLRPTFAGCADMDGYIHDAQCLVYSGPDTRFTGSQICFGFNEDTLTIYNVDDKSNPVILSRTGYGTARYTHQGWVNGDQDFVVMNDELDEQRGSVLNTRSYIINIESLTSPFFSGYYDHGVRSIDHNLYNFGDMHRRGWGGNPPMANPPSDKYFYCSNYVSGLRIIDATNIKDSNPQLSTAGFFKVSPSVTGNQFLGAWSAYLHPSGVIAVNVIETGVFFLDFDLTFDGGLERGEPTGDDSSSSGSSSKINGYNVAFGLCFVAAFAFAAYETVRRTRELKKEESQEGAITPREVAEKDLNSSRVENPMFADKTEV